MDLHLDRWAAEIGLRLCLTALALAVMGLVGIAERRRGGTRPALGTRQRNGPALAVVGLALAIGMFTLAWLASRSARRTDPESVLLQVMPWIVLGGLGVYGLFLVLRYLLWWVEIDQDEVRWRSSIGTHHRLRYADVRYAWVQDVPGILQLSRRRWGPYFRLAWKHHWSEPAVAAAHAAIRARAMDVMRPAENVIGVRQRGPRLSPTLAAALGLGSGAALAFFARTGDGEAVTAAALVLLVCLGMVLTWWDRVVTVHFDRVEARRFGRTRSMRYADVAVWRFEVDNEGDNRSGTLVLTDAAGATLRVPTAGMRLGTLVRYLEMRDMAAQRATPTP